MFRLITSQKILLKSHLKTIQKFEAAPFQDKTYERKNFGTKKYREGQLKTFYD